MPDFAYIARDNSGQKVTGTITAASQREALAALDKKALFPVQVAAGKQTVRSGKRIKPQLMATTYGQLAGLLRSGVPLLKALAVLREQTSHKNLKAILEEVHHRVEVHRRPLGPAPPVRPRIPGSVGPFEARHRHVLQEGASLVRHPAGVDCQ